MSADPKKTTVVDNLSCNVCGTEQIVVFHEGFPELRISASSAEQAAQRLVDRLKSSLDFLTDQAHRQPVNLAIADVQVFLDRKGTHPAREL